MGRRWGGADCRQGGEETGFLGCAEFERASDTQAGMSHGQLEESLELRGEVCTAGSRQEL